MYPDTQLPDETPRGVIGWKLEGLGCKDVNAIKDFCYTEYHSKPGQMVVVKPGQSPVNYSYSFKHSGVLTARRETDLADYNGGEICIFEVWVVDIEAPWLTMTPEQQLVSIKQLTHLEVPTESIRSIGA